MFHGIVVGVEFSERRSTRHSLAVVLVIQDKKRPSESESLDDSLPEEA